MVLISESHVRVLAIFRRRFSKCPIKNATKRESIFRKLFYFKKLPQQWQFWALKSIFDGRVTYKYKQRHVRLWRSSNLNPKNQKIQNIIMRLRFVFLLIVVQARERNNEHRRHPRRVRKNSTILLIKFEIYFCIIK